MLNFKRNAHASKCKPTTYKGVRFKSKFEAAFAKSLDARGVAWEYEPDVLYFQPPRAAYTPDFKITSTDGTVEYIETKGFFSSEDRTKMRCIKEQHPDVNIKMKFMRPSAKLYPKSKTTYQSWAEANGYECYELPPSRG